MITKYKKNKENEEVKSDFCVPNLEDLFKCKLTPEAAAEVYKMVNRRRPYQPSDFVKHHFIEDIADNPAEAAICYARNEFLIKGY